MKKYQLLLIAAQLLFVGATAQNATAVLDIANFRAPIRSDGQLFQNGAYNLPGLEWPKTNVPADKRYLGYTGQIWMAGHDQQGILRVAANEYGQVARGYFPGRAGFDHQLYDQVWKITKAEIDLFRADFASGIPLNFSNYPAVQTWPAFGTNVNGQMKPYAPFVDVNGNPNDYDPTAGDYPDVPGDQAIFFGFTDDPDSLTPQFPDFLGLDVIGFANAFDCPQLQDVMFLQYDLFNPLTTNYADFNIGLWMDSDIGDYSDDYFASDTTGIYPMTFTYNGDADDQGTNGYGLNPPACGLSLLTETAGYGMTYNNDMSAMGNPSMAANYAGYLRSVWNDSTPLSYGGTGHLSGGVATNFAFTGDDGYCGGAGTGWTGISAGYMPFDSRMILASPLGVLNASPKRFTFAIMMARGLYNDNKGSVCELKALRDSVATWSMSGQMSCANFATGNVAPSPSLHALLTPNPATTASVLRFNNPTMKLASVQLLDLQGRQIAAIQTGFESEFSLPTDHLAAGLYLVQLRCGNDQTSLRLLKE